MTIDVSRRRCCRRQSSFTWRRAASHSTWYLLTALSLGCRLETAGTGPASSDVPETGFHWSEEATGGSQGGSIQELLGGTTGVAGRISSGGSAPNTDGVSAPAAGGSEDGATQNSLDGTSGVGGATFSSSTATVACASGADPCSTISRFDATQIVDGKDDEFCPVPSFELDFTNAAAINEYNVVRGRTAYAERAVARVAWSTNYVHAFLRVQDPYVVPADSIDYIWGADSVELMISANSNITGNPADDPATLRIIAAPWAGSERGMAASVRTAWTISIHVPLPEDQYKVSTDAQGYSVELKIPWPNGLTASAASEVYFDLALNGAEEDITSGVTLRDAQAIFHRNDVGWSSPCGVDIQPFCDDRVWCSTRLIADG